MLKLGKKRDYISHFNVCECIQLLHAHLWNKRRIRDTSLFVKTFPQIDFLSLPVSAYATMLEIKDGDYDTIDYNNVDLSKKFVSW